MADEDDDEGTPLESDALTTLTESDLLKSRRMKFDVQELVVLVGEGLVRRGMDKDVLENTRWLWVSQDGIPALYLIFPGVEA